MSCFLVSENHINTILTWANANIQYQFYGMNNMSFKQIEDLQKMAELLLKENNRSVNYRYNEKNHTPDITFSFTKAVKAVQTIKLCDCLTYQSNETKNYYKTEAYNLIKHIRESAIGALPGYEESEWEV